MWVILFSDVLTKNRGEKEMIENAVLVYVKRIKFSEVQPSNFFILLNEEPGYKGVEVVTDRDAGNAHLFLKLHCPEEQKNNAISYGERSVCHIEPNRKVIPIKIW